MLNKRQGHLKKKKVAWGAAITGLAAAISLTGCAGNEPKSPGQTEGGSSQQGEQKIEQYGKVRLVRGSYFYNNKPQGVAKVIDYIKEQSGVEIEPIFAEDINSKFNLMIASKEAVDGTNADSNTYRSMIGKGLLQPLDEYLNKYGSNLKKKISPEMWEWAKAEDGKIYGVPSYAMPNPYTTMIREDWLKKLNLPVPKTIEEYERTLTAFKEKRLTTSNSKEEFYPLLTNINAEMSLLGAFLKDGLSWWKGEDGTYLPPEMSPEYKDFLSTLQRWYKNKLIHPESFVILSSNKHSDYVMQDLVGSTIGWYSLPFVSTYDKLKERVPDVNYVNVVLDGKYSNGLNTTSKPSSFIVVSATSENPEGVIRLLNWMADDNAENMIVSRIGLPGVMYNYVDRKNYKVENTKPSDPAEEYGVGTFEFLDLAGKPGEVHEYNVNPRSILYYETWDALNASKTYTTLDNDLQIDEGVLEASIKYRNDLQTAKAEQFVRIVSGQDPVDSWDDFLVKWRKMGMDQLIAEKNKLYKQRGKG
jgi:putative aldouronate transport system substrate-binding protein